MGSRLRTRDWNELVIIAYLLTADQIDPQLRWRKFGIEWELLNRIGWSLAHLSSRKIPIEPYGLCRWVGIGNRPFRFFWTTLYVCLNTLGPWKLVSMTCSILSMCLAQREVCCSNCNIAVRVSSALSETKIRWSKFVTQSPNLKLFPFGRNLVYVNISLPRRN